MPEIPATAQDGGHHFLHLVPLAWGICRLSSYLDQSIFAGVPNPAPTQGGQFNREKHTFAMEG
jgi:hypothetical protein